MEITDDEFEREQAYRLAQEASDKLDAAARILLDDGQADVHDLGQVAYDGDLDYHTNDGVQAITNAHSYLNNGQLGGLVQHLREE